jgi:hypothetical protein
MNLYKNNSVKKFLPLSKIFREKIYAIIPQIIYFSDSIKYF